jgi:CheY-like chemotaxis protein
MNPGAGEAGKVRADRNQIEQLLIHLSVCARDLLPDGGFFTLRTRLAESEAGDSPEGAGSQRFLLAAECHSLSPADREHPSPGDMVPWSNDLAALETCASIVKESHGSLCAGTYPTLPGALAIFFPLAVPMASPTEIPGTIPEGPVGRATVLLVEDDKGLRNLGRVVLTRMGYRVLEAENGVAGLRAFDSASPGEIVLVITDIVMPAMGGREMTEQICARVPSLPVLFISGYPEQFQQILQGKTPAAHAFLRKPFPMGELTAKVRELVGHSD